MREDNLEHFVCPSCHRSLSIESVEEREGDRIKKGFLICSTGQHRFPVAGFMPRFVSTDDATSAFGFEWNKHPRTQFDSVNGMRLSEERFFRQTNWPETFRDKKFSKLAAEPDVLLK